MITIDPLVREYFSRNLLEPVTSVFKGNEPVDYDIRPVYDAGYLKTACLTTVEISGYLFGKRVIRFLNLTVLTPHNSKAILQEIWINLNHALRKNETT